MQRNYFVFYSVLHRYPVITKDLLPWEIAKAEVDEQIAVKQQEVSASFSVICYIGFYTLVCFVVL